MKSVDKSGIHIVSFDVPFPTDYGGVIDVYHRCKSLKEIGVYVILHCFEYGRGERAELLKVANEVHYYPRKKSLASLLSKKPFIVASRNAPELLENLVKDNFPLLFEGIHTCFFLDHPRLKNRWKGVRAHNVEHNYYEELAKIESNFFRKLFFRVEAKKLEKYEAIFSLADEILTVTPKDTLYFKKKYKKGIYIPVFNPLNWGEGEKGTGNYALFHGNLSVMENEFAFRFITSEIWENEFKLRLIVAGKNPSQRFLDYLNSSPFKVECVANPSNEKLNQLIREAKINLLPTFQNTGIKHKLLNCLSNGAFCIANTPMVEGTGLERMCFVANTTKEWKKLIQQLTEKANDQSFFTSRQEELQQIFDCTANAHKIMALAEK